jgi:hypothetical protein
MAVDNDGTISVSRYDPDGSATYFKINSPDDYFDKVDWTNADIKPLFQAKTDYGSGFPVDKDNYFPSAEGLVLKPGRVFNFKTQFRVAKQHKQFELSIGLLSFRLIGKDGKVKSTGSSQIHGKREIKVDNTLCFGVDKNNGKMSREDSLAIYTKMKPTLDELDKLCKGFNIPGDSAYKLAKKYCEDPIDFSEKGIVDLQKRLESMQSLMGSTKNSLSYANSSINPDNWSKAELEAKITELKTSLLSFLNKHLANGTFKRQRATGDGSCNRDETEKVSGLQVSINGDILVIDYTVQTTFITDCKNTPDPQTYINSPAQVHIEEHLGNLDLTHPEKKDTTNNNTSYNLRLFRSSTRFGESKSWASEFTQTMTIRGINNSGSSTVNKGRKIEGAYAGSSMYSNTIRSEKKLLIEYFKNFQKYYEALAKK